MDYELKNKQLEADYNMNLGHAMTYGRMNYAALASKFEETDIGDDEESYDNFARGTLTDKSYDKPFTAAEEQRGNVAKTSGRLNLQYYGTRGTAEPPDHGEAFLGFMGAENADPRGYRTDPDMNKFTDQQKARMRFQHFVADAPDQSTGGGRSEGKVMADQQTLYKWTKDRLKVFSRQLDGRKEGLQKVYKSISKKVNQETMAAKGDHVREHGDVRARRVVLFRDLIRNTRRFREENMDADMHASAVNQRVKQAKGLATQNRVESMDTDTNFKASEQTKTFKTVSMLMNKVVGARNALQRTVTQDMDHGVETSTQARKHERALGDLHNVLREGLATQDFKTSVNTAVGKTKSMERLGNMGDMIVFNHAIPAQHYLTAERMYKTVKEASATGVRKIRDEVVRDALAGPTQDTMSVSRKGGRETYQHGMTAERFDSEKVDVIDRTTSAHNYKTAVRGSGGDMRNYSGESIQDGTKNTLIGKVANVFYRANDVNNTIDSSNFYENKLGSQSGGKLGNKNAVRSYMDRDGAANAVADRA